MEINIRYFSIFQKSLNRKEETVSISSQSTVQDLLTELVEKEGEQLRELIFTSRGKFKPALKVYVNEEQQEKYNRKLEDGDQVYLFMAFPGG